MSENMIQSCNCNDKLQVNGEKHEAEEHIVRVQPAADIIEGKESFIVNLDMPGLDPSKITVNLDKEVLTVEAKSEVDGFPPQMFYRQFREMRGLDASKCRADYKQGVLTLSLAKPTSAQPQQIKIQAE